MKGFAIQSDYCGKVMSSILCFLMPSLESLSGCDRISVLKLSIIGSEFTIYMKIETSFLRGDSDYI